MTELVSVLENAPGLVEPVGVKTVNANPLGVRGIGGLLFTGRMSEQSPGWGNNAAALGTGGFETTAVKKPSGDTARGHGGFQFDTE